MGRYALPCLRCSLVGETGGRGHLGNVQVKLCRVMLPVIICFSIGWLIPGVGACLYVFWIDRGNLGRFCAVGGMSKCEMELCHLPFIPVFCRLWISGAVRHCLSCGCDRGFVGL